jgi:hypothetical protein
MEDYFKLYFVNVNISLYICHNYCLNIVMKNTRRVAALAAFTGAVFMSSSEGLAPGIRPEKAVPEVTTAVDQVQKAVARNIVPRLGAAGLRAVALHPNEAPGHTDLIVTSDGRCATQFGFFQEPEAEPGVVRLDLNLFGRLADLLNESTVNSSAMWNGTIGHGDNLARATAYEPGEPESAAAAVDYIQQNHAIACEPGNKFSS